MENNQKQTKRIKVKVNKIAKSKMVQKPKQTKCNKLNINKMIRSLTNLSCTKRYFDMSEPFAKISTDLGSLLPETSDITLFEIDDILYDYLDNSDVAQSVRRVNESRIEEIIKNCFQNYHAVYLKMLALRRKRFYHTFDRTYLQLIEYSTDEAFEKCYEHRSVPDAIISYISSKETSQVIMGLKFLKVALVKHRQIMERALLNTGPEVFLWLTKLMKFPQAKSKQARRLFSWLRYQATAIFELLDFKAVKIHDTVEKYYQVYPSLREEICDANFINLLMRTTEDKLIFSSFHFDHLLWYFMSATSKTDKLDRLTNFLKGTFMSVKEDGEDEMASINRFIQKLNEVVKIFDEKSRFLIQNYLYLHDGARIASKYPRYELRPYLSECSVKDVQTQFVPSSFINIDNKVDESASPEDDNDDEEDANMFEPDLSVEKHLFVDDFMRTLHVLSIIHTAYNKCEKLLQIKLPGDGLAFRNGNIIQEQFDRIFLCPCRKFLYTPWCISVVLDKCPFLVMPSNFYHLKSAFLKVSGDPICPQIIKENLHFVLNSARPIRMVPEY